jgi:hypothetical protein
MFIVTRKKHEARLRESNETRWEMRRQLEAKLDTAYKSIFDYESRYESPDGKMVLNSLQDALRLILEYQRTLTIMSASDPHILQANNLLEKWGMKGEPGATYLGMKRNSPALDHIFRPDRSRSASKNLMDTVPEDGLMTGKEVKDRWEREEEYWGDEAYGTANVRIEMEAIDEGDAKEEGYTRAHVRFVDLDNDDLVYNDGTEIEQFPESDTID